MSVATAPHARAGDHRAPQSTLRPRGETVVQLVLLGVVCGALSLIDVLPEFVRLCLVFAFVALAPGNAMLMWWRGLSRAARTGLPPALGLALVTLVTTLEADVKWWHPQLTLVAFAASSLISVGVRTVAKDRWKALGFCDHVITELESPDSEASTDSRAGGETRGGRWIVPGLLGLAAVAWASSLPTIGHAEPSAFGLLAAAAPGYAISIALTGVAALVAIARRDMFGVFGATAAIVAVEHLSVTLATAVPVYPWTYKHIAVVDYIDRYGFVTRGVDVYHNWPGMFTTVAWVHQLTGVDVVTFAHWFTPVYHVAIAALFYATARAWRRTPMEAAVAAFIFEACNFVTQDYFSPQAFGFLLGLAVLLVLGESANRQAAAIPAIALFAAITVSHQLTPYWLILVTGALVVMRRVKSWWLPVVFAGIAGTYLYINYATIKQYGVVTSSDPLNNIRLRAQAQPIFGIRTQFYAEVLIYLLLFATAGLTLLSLMRKRREWRSLAALTFAPVLLLAAQGYGGEAIFRIMLYSLPGLCVVISAVVLRATATSDAARRRTVRVRRFAAFALAMITILAASHALLGSYSAFRVSKSQISAWNYFNRETPIGSRLISLTPGFPGNPEWHYVSRTTQGVYTGSVFTLSAKVTSNFSSQEDYDVYVDLVSSVATPAQPVYLVVSPQGQTYAHYYGVLPDGATKNISTHMRNDSRWRRVFSDDGTQIYLLVRPAGS